MGVALHISDMMNILRFMSHPGNAISGAMRTCAHIGSCAGRRPDNGPQKFHRVLVALDSNCLTFAARRLQHRGKSHSRHVEPIGDSRP